MIKSWTKKRNRTSKMSEQLPLDLKFLPSYGREDFMVTNSNGLAAHYVENWPKEWLPFPALTIYGPKGCGKSHLAAVWAERCEAQSLSVSQVTSVPATTLIEQGKNLVIDRLDLLVGDPESEEKLFHLYNSFQRDELFLLFMSHVSPQKLDFVIPDLASRLRASPVAQIEPPDDELLSRVLAKRLHDSGLNAPQNVVSYAVIRTERSWAAINRLVESILTKATSEKRPVTIPLIRDVLIGFESPSSEVEPKAGLRKSFG
jgi:chromosomal replication initiation ATPase DnaA